MWRFTTMCDCAGEPPELDEEQSEPEPKRETEPDEIEA